MNDVNASHECHTLKRENEENIIKSEFFVKFCRIW